MNRYETLFIIKPDQSEDEIEAVVDRLKERIEKIGGKLAALDYWGRRKLAYPVQYRGERLFNGYYILMTYVGDGDTVEEVERNIKIIDASFRYLSTKLEEGVDPEMVVEVSITKPQKREPVKAPPAPEEAAAPAQATDETTTEEKPAEEASADASAAEDKPAEESATDEPAAEDKPAEEAPTTDEEKPAEESGADEPVAEEKPAEEAPTAAEEKAPETAAAEETDQENSDESSEETSGDDDSGQDKE